MSGGDASARPMPVLEMYCEHGAPYTEYCEFCDAEEERQEELEAEDFDPEGPGL